eukprot:jgi/Bigna1/84677/fgenesh1_pg.205_\
MRRGIGLAASGSYRTRRHVGLLVAVHILTLLLCLSHPKLRLRLGLEQQVTSTKKRPRRGANDDSSRVSPSRIDELWLASSIPRVNKTLHPPGSAAELEKIVGKRLPCLFPAEEIVKAGGGCGGDASPPPPPSSLPSRWSRLLSSCANYSWLASRAVPTDVRIPVLVTNRSRQLMGARAGTNIGDIAGQAASSPSSSSSSSSSSMSWAGFFNGSEEERQEATIPFQGICEFALAREAGERHFMEDTGLQLYLSQCPVLTGATCERRGWEKTRGIRGILNNTGKDLPDYIEAERLCSVNLWLASPLIPYTKSIDSLFVARGLKIAILLPPSPSTSRALSPRSIVSRTPNDSPKSPREILKIAERLAAGAKGGSRVTPMLAVVVKLSRQIAKLIRAHTIEHSFVNVHAPPCGKEWRSAL